MDMTLETMRRDIAAEIGAPPSIVTDGDDLIGIGLDSLGVMKLASIWAQRGIAIPYAELLGHRTLKEWWELVETQSSAAARPPSSAPAPTIAVDERAPFDLATMQQAYWMGRQEGQALGTGSHYYFEFDGGGVDPARLEAAVRGVLARHGMLRVRVLEDGRQEIPAESAWPGLRVHDFRGFPPEQAARALEAIRQAESHRRLDVERGEGFDVQLSRFPDGATRVHINIDMLVGDAHSFRVVIDELARRYEDPSAEFPPLAYSYPRYLAEHAARRGAERQRAREYWQARLNDLPGPPQLPLAVEPERVTELRTGRRAWWIDPTLFAQLRERAQQHGVTVPMVLAAVFAEVLGAWSDEPELVLNVPFFDREPLHADVSQLVGDFSSSVLLAVDLSTDPPFVDRVKAIQERFRADAAHAAYPGLEVLRDLARVKPGEPRSRAAVVFTSAIGMGELFGSNAQRQFGRLSWMISQTSQVWLDHQATELDGGLLVNWDAMEPLFPPDVLDAMFAAYTRLLSGLIDPQSDWTRPVGDLLPPSQRTRRDAVNRTARPTSGRLLHQGFFEHAAANPERVAVAWGDAGEMTYGALADRAKRIAALLVARGVEPGDRVGITIAKGPRQIEAVLGILCAGAAYVPIGVEQPLKRRAQIGATAGARIVLTTAEEDATLDWPESTEVIALEDAANVEPLPSPVAIDRSALAYVIFTSGSTGEPKGVMVPHRAAMNTIDDIIDRFGLTASDRVLSVSALDFDWTVADIFELLSVGGAIVMIERQERRDAWRWAALVQRWHVTLWQSVPALLDMLLVAAKPDHLASLRLVMLGGDWAGLDQYARLHALVPECRLVVLGGITETSIHCTVFEVTSVEPHWRSIPYGAPLSNVKCRVVDRRGRDCPDWVPGELWVGGAGVARGYLGDPERTARVFVEHEGERWYRSGDMGRYWPDGTLEFLGRRDAQVKIRGHRIELGEIEAALEAYPGVARAVAATVESPALHLAAAVVARGPSPDVDALIAFARERLPDYMVPDRIVCVDRLPLSATDKIDRRAVRLMLAESAPSATDAFEAPQSDLEQRVADVWRNLLDADRIGRRDNFFTLGGDSLLATRMVNKLRAAGMRAGLQQLFSKPRLKDFAATVEAVAPPTETPVWRLDPAARHEPFPPTDVQRTYWLGRRADFALGGVGSQWYWEFEGRDVDVARLEAAWNRVVARHDMLRAVFDERGWQRVLDHVPFVSIPLEDAAGDPAPALDRLRGALSRRVADPSVWPLFDIRAVRCGDRTRVGFSFDYIVLDALSIMLVFDELSTLYETPDAELAPIALTFRDCVLAKRDDPQARAAAREYWDGRLPDLPPAPQLPIVKDPSLVVGGRFTRREARVDRARWQTLVARARQHDLTPTTVLAAAFTEVLAAWSGRSDMTLVFTLFDRDAAHPDIQRVVGDFTSLLLVPHRPDASASWLATARALQESSWASLQHRAVSALDLLRDLARRAGTPVAPVPVVFTSTLGVADDLVRLSFPFGSYSGGLSQTPQVYLDNQVVAHDGELMINWDAVDELFPDGVVDAMFRAYQRLIDWLSAPDGDWREQPPALIPEEQRAVRARVNATAGPDEPRPLHASFFARAAAQPDRLAVLGPDGRLTYGELADRALRIAGWLIDHDVRPNDLVAIHLAKGVGQIAAVLGALAAGAAYVPVGVDQPPMRRQRIFDSCRPKRILHDLSGALDRPPIAAPIAVAADALAYVIYTSGSTGEPKGVEITHRAAVNTVDDISARFGVGPDDRVLGISALDFDLSVYDIFGLLARGGRVALVGEGDRRDAFLWADFVRRERITIWNTVPALLDMLLRAAGDEGLGSSLRLAMVSGDWVGLDLRARLAAAAPGCRLVALGGATEASIWSNSFDVEVVPPEWRSIPYGFPLRNQQFRIVDERGRDCPDWVPGDLWIGGSGVARGYRNQPAETAARFLVRDGVRWYRTGDRGRYWPDGTLEFLGRLDFQVKVRGHRIELGEIESAIGRHPAAERSVAFTTAENRVIAAAVVPRPGATIDSAEMTTFLAQHVPASMIPDVFVTVPVLPLTSNGKIDREALTRLVSADLVRDNDDPPRGSTEEAVAAIWMELLGLPSVGRSRSFFALGGNSLLATALVDALGRRMGATVSLRELFANATIADLAAAIDRTLAAVGAADEGVV